MRRFLIFALLLLTLPAYGQTGKFHQLAHQWDEADRVIEKQIDLKVMTMQGHTVGEIKASIVPLQQKRAAQDAAYTKKAVALMGARPHMGPLARKAQTSALHWHEGVKLLEYLESHP